MPDKSECCEVLEIKKDVFAHQSLCSGYDGTEDADRLRKALKTVELGWWADTVIELHPKRQILNMTKDGLSKEHTWRDPKFIDLEDDHPFKKYEDSLIVEWVLPGVTLTLARGFTLNPMTGSDMSVYAVQEIRSNDERKRKIKPSPKR